MHFLKLGFYYCFLYYLPSSRFTSIFSKLRVWYFENVFSILESGGNESMIGPQVYISNGTKVSIGSGCRINENVYIEGAIIGKDVMIAPHVSILSRMHAFDRLDIPMTLQGYQPEKMVMIKDDVWLGRNVVVLPGVTIGKGAIIGSGAVVTADIPDYAIAGGVPARIIRFRNQD